MLLAIARAVAVAEMPVERFHAIEVMGFDRDEIDDSADRVGAVKNGRRSANHFHTIDRFRTHERRYLPEILLAATVVETDAVFEKENALAALSSDDRPALI